MTSFPDLHLRHDERLEKHISHYFEDRKLIEIEQLHKRYHHCLDKAHDKKPSNKKGPDKKQVVDKKQHKRRFHGSQEEKGEERKRLDPVVSNIFDSRNDKI